ncbi:Gfo/Idh/MocA family protein [Celeribacter marinus]|uniref:Putative oxidoreductase n=1 Tax=Celeribacter marinus TaxID=1397108 RepID=A0A0P0A767_9RHOB|nr:Gfo/Idh/MocA family oxidoreductase [Celeribacter marinus]ALI56571.1 putative oxidoreductase [Celeribacter marinus]SFK59285.1 Predicted dehydrogenase [Celeribacter marinus]
MPFPSTLPASRIPDPMDAPPLRWGVLGSGWIARQFIASTRAHTLQVFHAVGSRSREKAESFAEEWNIAIAHASYEALVCDPDVDVIYVTTPHNMHFAHVKLALEAGKHVLVEKPMTMTYAQGKELAGLAQTKRLFLAEALWTYFLPKFDVLQQVFDSGCLGEIKSIHTEYGEYFARDHRIFEPKLAGGPLLDLGTYPLSLITKLMGVPTRMAGLKQMDQSGVHGQISLVMENMSGNQATLATTLYGLTPTNAAIVGTLGTVQFRSEFNLPGPFRILSADGSIVLDYNEPRGRHFEGLFYEAAEVARCIAEGKTQTDCRPLSQTLNMLEALDKIVETLSIDYSASV